MINNPLDDGLTQPLNHKLARCKRSAPFLLVDCDFLNVSPLFINMINVFVYIRDVTSVCAKIEYFIYTTFNPFPPPDIYFWRRLKNRVWIEPCEPLYIYIMIMWYICDALDNIVDIRKIVDPFFYIYISKLALSGRWCADVPYTIRIETVLWMPVRRRREKLRGGGRRRADDRYN